MDGKSVTGWVLTITGGWLTEATKSDIIFLITVLAGITTVVYNIVKVHEWFKKRKK